MNIDTTILGYVVHECSPVCLECATDEERQHPDYVINRYNSSEWDPDGLTCDRCLEYIVEPIKTEAEKQLEADEALEDELDPIDESADPNFDIDY